MVRIVRATLSHLPLVAPLFNAYRVFYKQPDDMAKATQFMQQRLEKKDSIVLLAQAEDQSALGFAQLYRRLSSVGAVNELVLNDLFVNEAARRQGIGRALMNASIEAAEAERAFRLTLETAPDNKTAQALYESSGFTRTASSYYSYALPIKRISQHEPLHPSYGRPVNREGRKLVVITGVTSGLGGAMLDEFASRGWMIAGCGRSVNEINKLRDKFGDRHAFDIVDVADNAAITQWAESIKTSCGGKIDLLINNASIVNRPGKAWEIPLSEFEQVMDINVMGVVRVTHALMPMMSPEGVIINISSNWGRNGDENVSAYCASKFAIEGLTQSMAKELPQGMAVVSLDPRDGVRTPMLQICCPEYMSQAPTPEDWAHTAVPYMLEINASNNGEALTCPVPTPAEDKKKTSVTDLSFLASKPEEQSKASSPKPQ